MLDTESAILYDRAMKISRSSPRAFEFASAAQSVVAGAGKPVSRSNGSYGQATAAGSVNVSQRYAQMKAREEAEKRNEMRKRVGLPPL